MAEVRWTAAAQKDLVEIGDLIAADNRRAAFAFVEGIRQHCSLLSSTPLMGRPRPEIGARVRSFPMGATSSPIVMKSKKAASKFSECGTADGGLGVCRICEV